MYWGSYFGFFFAVRANSPSPTCSHASIGTNSKKKKK